MSLNDNTLHRDRWSRRCNAVIREIDDLKREVEIALRQQPVIETGWRLAAADVALDMARRGLRQAIAKIRQIN